MSELSANLDQILGARLRRERERAGLTQGEVATSIGIPRQAVSEIENGHRSVGATELFRLCRLFALDVNAFFRVSEPAPTATPIFFRADRLQSDGKAAIARFRNRCSEYRELEDLLADHRTIDIRPVTDSISRFEDARRLAEEERHRLDLGSLPAWLLLSTLEERVGIKVLAEKTEWTLSGACSWGIDGPSLFLNSAHVAPRIVFTMAHEYFHLLAPSAGGSPGVEGIVCGIDPETKSRADVLADQFAAELLMPTSTLEARLGSGRARARHVDGFTAIRLAVEFGVSLQAMLYKLGNMGALGRRVPKDFYADPDVRDEERRVRDGCEALPAEPRRFELLAIRAHLTEEVSRGRLAELLGINIAEIEERIAPFARMEELDERLGHSR